MSYGNWFQWTTTDLSKLGSFPSLNSFDWIDFFRFHSKVKAAVSVATPTDVAADESSDSSSESDDDSSSLSADSLQVKSKSPLKDTH